MIINFHPRTLYGYKSVLYYLIYISNYSDANQRLKKFVVESYGAFLSQNATMNSSIKIFALMCHEE